MGNKRFRIAFSFAGEKRDFVAKVAGILAQRFGQEHILYDKYYEAKFARSDLGILLPDLYHKESDLIVTVFCKDYENKEWCGLEWTAIHALIKERKVENVMLCRFDHMLPRGLFSTAGFVELDRQTPEQAANLILERLADNEGHPRDHYTKPAATNSPVLKSSIPNNLPRLQSFFGREHELAQIREAIDPENRTWGALIDGPGGMGKTSLAVRAAYECPPGQFQRIIFVSVKDREMDDDGVRRLTGVLIPGFLEMLNELARELGQPDIPKSPEDQRVRLLLDALRDAKALLILDNLESLPKSDRDQLFSFVKRLPQGCKAILTSRRRIGSGSEELILEQLDQTAALATLADLARHNKLLAKTSEAERIALYTQTGGKPLLLRWTAGQLGRGSCRTFTDALAFLCSCPKDNDPLEFIFGDLVEEFTPDETRVLCALMYFNLPAKVEHIAAIAGGEQPRSSRREKAQVQRAEGRRQKAEERQSLLMSAATKEAMETALRSLANRSLVVPDQEEEAFALVPMVADFLCRARPEVVIKTGNRLVKRAYTLIVENGCEKHDCYSVLNAAWPTVAAALPLFFAGPEELFQIVCHALDGFLYFTGRWDEWLSMNQLAETKAVANGDFYDAGWRAIQAGRVHDLRHQVAQVLPCADRAAKHWRRAKAGVREEAIALQLHGQAHQLAKNYPAAGEFYLKAFELFRSSSIENADVAKILCNLAAVCRLSGKLGAAEVFYGEAWRVAHVVGHAEIVAGISVDMAGLALARKDCAKADAIIREALPWIERVGRQDLIGVAYGCLAQALARQGKKTEGLSHARHALEIFTKLGSPEVETARAALAECES